MAPRPRPPSFADACARVVADPDADHSLSTTLAPVQARIDVSDVATATAAARRELLGTVLPADVERVLELGCGTGTLLDRLGDDYVALGVDSHQGLLSFAAARGADVVCGDPTDPPLARAFDAACAFGNLTARRPLSAVCEGAYATLRPGGIVAVAVLTDVDAAVSSGIETYRSARYVLERSVDVARSPPAVNADYRVTDLRTGEVGVTSERTRPRVTDAETARETLETVGFTDASVLPGAGEDGERVLTAVRPVETGGDRRQG